MDFTVIERAGLTQQDFATLVGVSRVTTNAWVGGKLLPHKYVRAKIVAILGHLEDALAFGALPLKPEPTPMNKPAVLMGVVRDAMARGKVAAVG
jgi:DNA-binding XRE family transcriptional regulator